MTKRLRFHVAPSIAIAESGGDVWRISLTQGRDMIAAQVSVRARANTPDDRSTEDKRNDALAAAKRLARALDEAIKEATAP